MKKDTHPTYYDKATTTCACGAVHKIGSTREKMTVEICNECHPFYTGKEKLVDTAGRVEKFRKRSKEAETKKVAKPKKTSAAKKSAKGGSASGGKATPVKKPTVKKAAKK